MSDVLHQQLLDIQQYHVRAASMLTFNHGSCVDTSVVELQKKLHDVIASVIEHIMSGELFINEALSAVAYHESKQTEFNEYATQLVDEYLHSTRNKMSSTDRARCDNARKQCAQHGTWVKALKEVINGNYLGAGSMTVTCTGIAS